ncbi:MAG: hypothetical protein IJ437_03850 [Clostridia bacterium]|nr:hypothetical protein [Clostridia bacterium]
MSKRTTLFLSLLALITALLSAVFILVSFFVDVFAGNEVASLTFEEIRTAFDLIAEYTALGIVIYAFCRYSFKDAKRSILIALGSFIFSFLFQIIATGAIEFKTSDASSEDIWLSILMFSAFGLLGLFIERILPCLLIAFIAYIFTKNGTKRITKIFSLKNPIQRAMLVSALAIYLINAVPTLILYIIEIVGIGGTSQLYIEEFMLNYVVPHLLILLYNFILTYVVFLAVYIICNKYAESAPIKKVKKTELASDTNATPSEE